MQCVRSQSNRHENETRTGGQPAVQTIGYEEDVYTWPMATNSQDEPKVTISHLEQLPRPTLDQRADLATHLESDFESRENPLRDDNSFILADFFGDLEPVNEAFKEWSSATSFDSWLPTTGFDILQAHEDMADVPAAQILQNIISAPAEASQANLKSPDRGNSKSDITEQVSTVYSTSLGAWEPDSQDYSRTGEPDLFVKPTDIKDLDTPRNPSDGRLPQWNLDSPDRDRLLALVVQAILPENIPRCISTFPVVEVLRGLAATFFLNHSAELVPFIHITSFSHAKCDTGLLAVCVSSGAVRSHNLAVRNFGFAMSEVIRLNLEKTVAQRRSLVRDTC